ncbi:probable het-c2 protein [Melanopsichium pennsylvanicum]|uniref:Probable het-c2 protein n=1 Tax=Melanopsichium pennsylvanicum TaxID=63383 RepID=A0AAJ4XLQ8_9BASI|nr:probable het-c2 protein [Melanopsichium pennsylvanicum]
MSTFFEECKRSFTDVPTEGGVDTAAFLEACEGFIKLFDVLGNSAFKIVQNDMNGNIAKVQTRLNATGAEKSGTLEKLVQNEGPGGSKNRPATEGLMWLLRALDFTATAMRNSMNNKNEELVESFTKAYGSTLRPHHGMLVRPVFALAMKACPYRKDFYAKLGPQDKVDQQMEQWMAALEKIVAHMKSFYASGKYDKGF